MPRITSVAIATPPYRVHQSDIKHLTREIFAGSIKDIDRYLTVFDHSEIETRFLAAPLSWFTSHPGFAEANRLWADVACALGVETVQQCLEAVDLGPEDVDHIFFVSTTGLATPSIDAHIMLALDMPRNTKRTPIWGLGCAGGVSGLARASEYVRAFPGHRALLVCVELCSLTFKASDCSVSNVIAASLFSDGAAAVLIEGDEVSSGKGPEVLATESTLFPDSLDLMGWEVIDTGLRTVFGTRIPGVVTTHFPSLVDHFLNKQGICFKGITHHVYHPGGAKVLRAYEQAVQLPAGALTHSRAVLREYGNMSSTTVLYVLKKFLDQGIHDDEYALLTVFGPGFSSELALLKG
ncbi:MAG TPA: 3-oxoacyl-[acyl-carrier-protein] synthase III C-terminal domain-containing protein [Ktedonobacteraceae bacterium]|jgi:alkylresorcinol/alkylpyrone synthase|nr:3-oxoacyl-[acyl-carrier-protein] synthase III C-terminal domain-containing protein [Ktedonobacteraceae bacterium]